MKYLLYIFLLFAIVLTSCETTSSDNGELDNMWYLTKVDSLYSGKTIGYREKHILWSFQGTLMQTNCVDSVIMGLFYMCRFENKGDQLIIKSPFIYDRVHDDSLLTTNTLHKIRPYGINSLTDTFKIEKLHNDVMILKGNMLRLYFDKY